MLLRETVANAPINVSDHAAFVIGEKIYIVGGYDEAYNSLGTSTPPLSFRTFWKFDVNISDLIVAMLDMATMKWTTTGLGSLNIHRGDLVTETFNGKGYAFGGSFSFLHSSLFFECRCISTFFAIPEVSPIIFSVCECPSLTI